MNPKLIRPKRLFAHKEWYKDLWDRFFTVKAISGNYYIVIYKGKQLTIPKHHCDVLDYTDAKVVDIKEKLLDKPKQKMLH